MYNIRIKQLPKNGDQRNYSLVDRNDLYIKVNPINQDSNVKNTISAVPREQANIEAEGGETVIGDINNDGFLEHSKIVGKRHTQGGVPLNVAPGSFIFSDTKKLKIKDPQVLSIFGITKFDKGGVTPAKIAQKYPMNNYMNILKDESTDHISKRTAAKMLENNLEKLGMLALVQESMKGFPDGIPAIAQSVMAGLQGGQGMPQETMEGREAAGEEGQMKWGGGYYQTAGTTKEKKYPFGDNWFTNWFSTPLDWETGKALTKEESDARMNASRQATTSKPPKKNTTRQNNNPAPVVQTVNVQPVKKGSKPAVGQILYDENNTPLTIVSADIGSQLDFPYSKDYIKLSNGQTLTLDEYNQMVNGKPLSRQDNVFGYNRYSVTPNRTKRNLTSKIKLTTGDSLNFRGEQFTVLNPFGENTSAYQNNMKSVRDMFDDTEGIITVKDSNGNIKFLEGEDLKEAFALDPSLVLINPPKKNVNNNSQNRNFENQRPLNDSSTFENEDAPPANFRPKKVVKENEGAKQKSNNKPANIVPAKVEKKTSGIITEYVDEDFKYGGGYLPKHQGLTGSSTVGDTSSSSMMDDGSSNGFFGGIGDFFSDLFGGDNNSQNNSATSSLDQQAMNAVANPGSMSSAKSNTAPVVVSQPLTGTTTQAVPTGDPNKNGQGPGNKTIVKWQISNKTGKKRPVYSDGTVGEVIEYNVADEDLRTEVAAKGYDFIDLKPEFRYQGKTVGHQTAQSGYKVDPESGFLYKDIKPGTAGLENYMEIHADAINAFPGGAEAWKKTMLENPGKENAAMTHLLNYENAAIGLLSGDRPYVDLKKPGALVPGVENFNLPGIRKKPETKPQGTPTKKQAYICEEDAATGESKVVTMDYDGDIMPAGSFATYEEAEASCLKKTDLIEKPSLKKKRPWWLQDTVNYAGAMSDTVNYYPPAMSQVDYDTPGYALMDPDRQIAAIQEAAARQTEASMNTTAGNVAGASIAGQSDQRLGQAANVIGGVENQNVGIYNNVVGRISQIKNQERLTNEQLKQKYIAESATARQNYDNAKRALKWRQLDAFNNGVTNWQRTNQLADMFNYDFDRYTGDVTFSGGRPMFDAQGRPVYDPYINPTNPNDTSSLSKETFESRFNYWRSKGLSAEDASRNANAEINGKAATLPYQTTGRNAILSGQALPRARQQKYGGKVKKQYGGVVFDFGALPLFFFED